MSSSEQERVLEIMEDKSRGSSYGRQLFWDPSSKSIRAAKASEAHGDMLQANRSDMNHYANA